ncbi:type II secretion system protein [bacterium]|nr:type II secretion system protein [bacterium]
MNKRAFSLVEIMISMAVLGIFLTVGFSIYNKVVRGTAEKQSELIQITSKCRLAAKYLNYELTNAHSLISPTLTEQRTYDKLCYTDKTDGICALSVVNGSLIKENMTFNTKKIHFNGIFNIFFTRLDDNLLQYRIKVKTRKNQFEVISCVFVKYEK